MVVVSAHARRGEVSTEVVPFQFPAQGDWIRRNVLPNDGRTVENRINLCSLPANCNYLPRWILVSLNTDTRPGGYISVMGPYGARSVHSDEAFLRKQLSEYELKRLKEDPNAVPAVFAAAVQYGLINSDDINIQYREITPRLQVRDLVANPEVSHPIFASVVLLRGANQDVGALGYVASVMSSENHDDTSQRIVSPAQAGFSDVMTMHAKLSPAMAYVQHEDKENLFQGLSLDQIEERVLRFIEFLGRKIEVSKVKDNRGFVRKFETITVGAIIASIANGQVKDVNTLLGLFDVEHPIRQALAAKGISAPVLENL